MKVRLKEAFLVDFDVIDFSGKMSIHGLSNYMQMIASHHANELEFNFYKNGNDAGLFWIISKVKYVMESYPKWDEKITIETYPGGYDKLYAVRLFDICNDAGQKIGYIIGDYLLMDSEKLRPVRIKGGQGALKILDFPYEGEKLQKLKEPDEIIKEERRKAYYSEMDLNGHMNNSHYVKWAMDMLPLELIKNFEVSSLEINYNASIQYGAEVKMLFGRNKSGTYIVSGSSVEEGKNYFIAEIKLQEREKCIELK